jgi:hypothetical protein
MLFNLIFALSVCFVADFLWRRYKKNKQIKLLNNPDFLIEQIEEKKAKFIPTVTKSFERSNWDVYADILKDVDHVESQFLQLKERYVHDKEKLLNIIRDFDNYLASQSTLYWAWRSLDVDLEDGASDRFDDEAREPRIRISEIKKRFDKLSKE